MKLLKRNLLGILLTAAAFGVAAVMAPKMPDPVPTHWNIHGVADGFTPKPWGPFVLPLVMVGLLALFMVLGTISPKEAPVEKFARTFSIITTATLGFLFVTTVVASLAATGAPFNLTKVIMAAVGVLFVVIGNYMGKFTRNYIMGIRTPWTLANDEVWLRTHRLGGKVFVVGGLAVVAVALLDQAALALPLMLATALIPVVYSYLVYRKVSNA
ncbi:MAG: SdpI family protein [Polyangiaceae bacterium]|nr:SdpI family protein [Polyangiaceae bacterium]